MLYTKFLHVTGCYLWLTNYSSYWDCWTAPFTYLLLRCMHCM